jgi:hypothetical protein
MQQPSAWVISPEPNRGRTTWWDSHGIPSHGVGLFFDRRVDRGIVGEVVHGLAHDLEFMSVQVERVETGVTVGHEI